MCEVILLNVAKSLTQAERLERNYLHLARKGFIPYMPRVHYLEVRRRYLREVMFESCLRDWLRS